MESQRFSDAKLQKMHEEFEMHKEEFAAYRLEQQALHNDLLLAIKENTGTVANVADKLADFATKTETIIEIYEASRGAFKIFKWAGSILKWLAMVGAAIFGVIHYLKSGWKW